MEPVTIMTDDGVRLEGELRMPDDPPRGSAVICHAHPRHGGSKDHPVLWSVRNELAGMRGLATLVFTFRGTMGGYCPAVELRAYSDGVAEVVVVDGTDHYLWRHEREAAAFVGDLGDRILTKGGREDG